MAINFLNKVDFNQNEIDKARLVNEANDTAAGTPVDGQLYYNTTDNVVKVGEGGVWVSISGDITELSPGTYINIDNPGGPIPTINHDLTTRSNTTSTAAPASGATFTALDSITTNTTGHVTAVNTKTVTLPAEFNEKYTLPTTTGVVSPGSPTTGIISLTGSTDGVVNKVTFTGTTGRIDVAGSTVGINGAITIDLTDDVTIVDDLTVGGVITNTQSGETNTFSSKLDMGGTGSVTPNKIINLATGTAATDAVNLGQVELLVAGVGVFQGGYSAATDPGTPVISGASNIALDQGDYFVVTADGDITFSDTTVSVEVGDFIFANVAIAASSNPPSTKYTFVLADANIAGAGSTDAGTEKGVAGFDSANFDVSASGWVQLNSQRNPYGAKQSLNNTAPSSRAEAGGITTFTLNLAAASLFGTGALSENIKVEVTEGAAPFETVYACVTRSGSASMAIGFTGSVANDAYQVLLTHV